MSPSWEKVATKSESPRARLGVVSSGATAQAQWGGEGDSPGGGGGGRDEGEGDGGGGDGDSDGGGGDGEAEGGGGDGEADGGGGASIVPQTWKSTTEAVVVKVAAGIPPFHSYTLPTA